MPESLWCRSIRKPGSKRRASIFSAFRSSTCVAGEPAAEHLDRGLDVDAVRLEEDDRLGE